MGRPPDFVGDHTGAVAVFAHLHVTTTGKLASMSWPASVAVRRASPGSRVSTE